MLWSPNTQLHYPFENTALDYSGHARHGTINGSGVFATKPGGGRCLYFDGTGDYVKTPSFGLSGTVVVFAADVRVKLQATQYQAFLGDNAFSVTVGYLCVDRPKNTNYLAWYYADGTTSSKRVEAFGFFAAPYDDAWVHLCVVCDYSGKVAYVYRAGVLFSTLAMVNAPVFPSTDRVKYVGGMSPTSWFLTDGYMANVQLWTLATMPPLAVVTANANRLMLGMNPIWSV